jgi:arabinogalactan endo-1,4-beta-galactosidase
MFGKGALGIAVVALAVAATQVAGARTVSASVTNPGFEADGQATTSPSGWHNLGSPGASKVEAGGHSGSFQLTHVSDRSYAVTTTQLVNGLDNGWITLTAWVRSSTGKNLSAISLACGGAPVSTQLPDFSGDWLRITVSAFVRTHSCLIALSTAAAAGEWANFDDVSLAPGAAQLSIRGADVSSLKKSEDLGGVYRDEHGRPGDALRILRDHGLDWIRLRVFVNPYDGYHGTDELLTMAKRAKALGLKVLVDFHYSDFWADPGKQWTPDAWEQQAQGNFATLDGIFKAYNADVIGKLVAQGTPPDMVQIGNEINPGMLWDYGASWTGCSTADDGTPNPYPANQRTVCHTENWDQLAQLLTDASTTIKSISPGTKIMIHLTDPQNTVDWWLDQIAARNVPYDVIGLSWYPYWHGTLAQIQQTLDHVSAKYGKDVVIAETAYPFTFDDKDGWPNVIGDASALGPATWPPTPAGQAAMLRDLMTAVRAVQGGRGLGVFWWDATWTGVPGNGWTPRDPAQGNAWENQALFGYDDRALPAMDELRS